MSQINLNEFKAILLKHSLEYVVKEYVFQGTPYVFRKQPEVSKILYQHLCKTLEISEQNLVVVGSAKIGFSLSPDNFPRPFSDESDIDILVVDEKLFDEVWTTVLKWHYPRRIAGLHDSSDKSWATKMRKEIYWGWIIPDRIRYEGLSFPEVLKPVRDISTRWFNAFQSLSQYNELASRNISGRLYRSWNHALLYHVDGLRQVKDIILGMKKGV